MLFSLQKHLTFERSRDVAYVSILIQKLGATGLLYPPAFSSCPCVRTCNPQQRVH